MDRDAVENAVRLLGCRSGAAPVEVRAAYRAALHRARPDTGGVDGAWVVGVQAARDLLLRAAAPDRRRRERQRLTPRECTALRRSTWSHPEPLRPAVDVRL